MGQGAVNEIVAPPVRPAPRPSPIRLWGFDPWLMIMVGIMIVFGLVMVYSASWDVSYRLFGNPNALTVRQLSNLVIGLMALAAAAVFPIRYLRRLATPVILGTIFLLFVLLLVSAGAGPRRAFLAGSVQPSELAKLAVIIYLAVWMESKGERLSEWGYGFLPLMTIIGIVGGLIRHLDERRPTVAMALVMFTWRRAIAVYGDRGSAIVGYILVG
jgi:cell division protein FtsW